MASKVNIVNIRRERRNTTVLSASIAILATFAVYLFEYAATRLKPFRFSYYCDGNLTIATKM